MKRRLGVFGLVIAAVSLTAEPAFAVKTGGTYSWWDMPSGPHYNLDSHIFVGNNIEPGQPYLGWFFSHQFWPANGSPGGYIGIQVDSRKKAIFSWWGAVGSRCSTVVGAECGPFSGEGSGQRTLIPYNWKTGVDYRARVWIESTLADGRAWWIGAIADMSTNVETVIGRILVPATYGWLDSGVNWTEDYGPDKPSCANYVQAVVFFRRLLGNANTTEAYWPPANDVHTAPCPSTIVNWGDPWVQHIAPR